MKYLDWKEVSRFKERYKTVFIHGSYKHLDRKSKIYKNRVSLLARLQTLRSICKN